MVGTHRGPAYASIGYLTADGDLEGFLEQPRGVAIEGFTAAKIKIGTSVAADRARSESALETPGPSGRLMVEYKPIISAQRADNRRVPNRRVAASVARESTPGLRLTVLCTRILRDEGASEPARLRHESALLSRHAALHR